MAATAAGPVSHRHDHSTGGGGAWPTNRLPGIDKIHPSEDQYNDFNPQPLPSNAPQPTTPPHLPTPSRATYLNANLYIKLLNSTYNPNQIQAFLDRSPPHIIQAFTPFLISRLEKFQTIFACLGRVVIEPDPEKVMLDLLSSALRCVGGKDGSVYILQEKVMGKPKSPAPAAARGGLDTDTLTGQAAAKCSTWHTANKQIPLSAIHTLPTLLTGSPTNTHNLKSSALSDSDSVDSMYAPLDPECILSVPIFAETGSVVGVIEIVNKEERERGGAPYFDAEDEFMVGAMSSLWTLMLAQSSVRKEAMRKSDDIRVLLNTASLMSSELDLGDLITVIMKTAQDLLSAERCSLFMVDKEKHEIWSTVAHGTGEIRLPMNKGIAGHVATSGQILNINDAYNDPRFNRAVDLRTGYHTRNILCMPMRSTSGDIIGVTQVINKKEEGSVFCKEDELLLMAFSSLAAVTIEKSILFKDLQITLAETSEMKNFLSHIMESITSVVMTLDAEGKLITINHPKTLSLTSSLPLMHTSPYTTWLRPGNETLIADIQRAYSSPGIVMAQDYEMRVDGGVKCVNYTIVQMAKGEEGGRQGGGGGGVRGVVIVMEDISREKRVLSSLGRYMSPALVHQVMNEAGSVLGGTRQKVSVLFADLRNFTAISENMDPSEVVSLLNDHYSSIVDAIMDEGGILDKYIGDAAMACFGVPFPSPNDSLRSVSCALRMNEGLEHMNRANVNKGSGKPVLGMGIGICTGKVLSGNIGSDKRMEYTVIGDTVNVASRIENATKCYGVPILICDTTHTEVKKHFHTREIDAVQVKGRTKPVTIFEVVARGDVEIDENTMTAMICYEMGLAEYRAQRWQDALSHFRKGVQLINDPPSKTFVERCRAINEGSVIIPEVWDGVWVFDKKI